MTPILTLAKITTKRYLRDKTAIFFTFLFPIVFLIVFGYINKGDGGASFDVAIFNRSSSQFSKNFVDLAKKTGTLKIKDVADEPAAREKLSRSEMDAYMILPEDFGMLKDGKPSGQLIVKYSEGSAQTGQALSAFMEALTGGFNQKISPYSPPFVVKQEAQNLKQVSKFDFTLSGLIGFSLMSLGVFGVVNGFISDKKTGAIARLRVTPLKAWQLIVATAINRVFIAIISVILMLIVGALMFGFRMHGNWPSFIIMIVISAISMFGIGLALGGWAKSEEQAAPLANLVTFPMMFLSGVFFPTFLMPLWLQNISHYIPLTPIVDGLRQILTEGKTLFDLGPQLLIILGWTVVSYVIAGKVFRWE